MAKFRFWLVAFGIMICDVVAQPFLPWWSLVVIAIIWGFGAPLHPRTRSFWAGFIAGALLWGGYAFYLNQINEGLLAERVGSLLGGAPGPALPALSGVFAGIMSGLGALCGSQARDLIRNS